MEEPFPTPPSMVALIRTLQLSAVVDHPNIRTDGQMDEQTLAFIQKKHALSREYTTRHPNPDLFHEKDTIRTAWETMVATYHERALLAGKPIELRSGGDFTQLEQLNERYMAMQENLQAELEVMQKASKHTANNVIEAVLSNAAPSDKGLNNIQRALDTYFGNQDVPMQIPLSPRRIEQLLHVLPELKIKSHEIPDFWREQMPQYIGHITRDGKQALDSLYTSRLDPAVETTTIYYSFEGRISPVDIDFSSRTGPNKTTNIADPTHAQRELFNDALNEISSVANIRFVEVKDGIFPPEASARWRVLSGTIGDPEAGAYAHYPRSDGIPQAIVFDPNKYSGMARLREAMLHEAGHALGLKHPFGQSGNLAVLAKNYDETDYTLMSYKHTKDLISDSLRPLDIATLQKKYGPAINNPGNTHYHLYDDSPTRVIFDSGGHNIVDASAVTGKDGVSLDLSGEIYRTDSRPKTLKITENTRIAEVIGSNGNDVVHLAHGTHTTLLGNGGQDRYVLPKSGIVVINDFSLADGDSLDISNIKAAWKTQVTAEGYLHARAVDKQTNETIDLFLRDPQTTPETLLKELATKGAEKDSPLADSKPQSERKARKSGMESIVNDMRKWAQTLPPINEAAEIKPGDISRISATPLDGIPAAGKPR